MAFIQGVLGPLAGTVSSVSSNTGSAVTAGNAVVGLVFFRNSTNILTSVTDNASGNTYSLLTAVQGGQPSPTGNWLAPFAGIGVKNGPTVMTGNFSASVQFPQIVWLEYSNVASVSMLGGQNQIAPGTGADAITTGSFTAVSSTLVGMVAGNAGTSTIAAGTNYTQRLHDTTNGNWNVLAEDRSFTGGSVAATFTDATNGGTSTIWYITALLSLLAPSCGGLLLTGVGCGIWAAKKLEENNVIARRQFLVPGWPRHPRSRCRNVKSRVIPYNA